MKKQIFAAMLATLVFTGTVEARDDELHLPVSNVMENDEYASQLAGVKFYFGDQPHPAVASRFGEWQSNKKTNAFNKSDQFACDWAFLTAMKALRDRALSLGADAVINIRSNYKKRRFESQTEYMCGAGKIMAGVTMRGEMVKLAK